MSETETTVATETNQADNASDRVEDGKNSQTVKCKFCGLKILDKKAADLVTHEINLPLMLQDSRKDSDVQQEKVGKFWHVESIYTFENIGLTHTVEDLKYLSCADCDAGPVGYYDTITKHSYVALARVNHV